jgi:Zn-dependent protease/CBS domain-containing protein
MKWSFRLVRIAGIDVYVHFTFPLLLLWVLLAHYLEEHRWEHAVAEAAFVLVVFGVVVLHEMGHALAAQRYGIRTRDITLLPIGGVARLDRIPDDPRQELLVALVGPAVNVVLAAGLYVGAMVLGGVIDSSVSLLQASFVSRLFWVNVLLAVFNLLPAFPMDGGRVLRALLALRMDYVRATEVAARVGQGMALLFGFAGLFSNPFLVFIALFVWIGAAQEASIALIHAALGGIPVERVMVREFQTVTPEDTVADAVAHVLGGFQHDFPVLDGDRLVGVLAREDLFSALAAGGTAGTVGDIMRRKFETADPGEMLEHALTRLQQSGCPAMPVTRNASVVGVLTTDNVGEFVMVQAALRNARPRTAQTGTPRSL